MMSRKKKSYTVSLDYYLVKRLQAIKSIKKGEVDIGFELYLPILNKIKELEGKYNISSECWKYIKNCDKCNDGKLVLRKGKSGDFLGCTNYPKCKKTEKLK